jgi:hypothetical protein
MPEGNEKFKGLNDLRRVTSLLAGFKIRPFASGAHSIDDLASCHKHVLSTDISCLPHMLKHLTYTARTNTSSLPLEIKLS